MLLTRDSSNWKNKQTNKQQQQKKPIKHWLRVKM
jgi:hypothetical protein